MNNSKQLVFRNMTKFSFLTLLISVIFFACAPSQNDGTAEDANEAGENAEVKDNKLIYPLSTPVEITHMLIAAQASYLPNVTNAKENIDRYDSEKKQALNLGIYGADLSYLSTYNQIQETNFYLSNIQKLSDQLGIANAFDQTIADRIEQNIDNKDSLHAIITGSFESTYESLNENGMGDISVLVLAGGWIEGLYLATQIAATSGNNTEIISIIAQQKEPLSQLLATLNLYKDKPNVVEIIQQLTEVKAHFENIESTMTAEQLEELTLSIEHIRNGAVE